MSTDIIIVGAGLVGTSLAAALDSEIKITLLEKQLPDFSVVKNDRPLSLSFGSQRLLARWGLWPSLASHASAIDTVHVSEQGRFGVAKFSAQQQKVAALGYVVSFNALHQALYEKICQQDNVTVIQNHEINRIDCDATQSSIFFNGVEGEQQLNAQLLVAADGNQSRCRELMKIPVKQADQQGFALIFQLALSEAHQQVAYERFTKMGTMAVLPLFSEQEARLVWTLSEKNYDAVKEWSDESLLQHVQEVFSGRLEIDGLTRTQMFPLQTIIAREQTRPGFVLLGNAAHSIFPVAAQGFNLGLRDVQALSGILNDARQNNQTLHDEQLLQQYLALRKTDQKRIAAITKGTLDIFDLDLPGLGALRGMGLLSLDMLSVVKKRFAKRLMGAL
ncbi:MAG: FAD-dependent monooxygenase [Gammaproteobacteria bacterium]|nr:FAD-dependent monooxygenase [Gammaproteobacteria bacterium]MCH9745066.1 FAD-dependent monooxygenase [Gammaproteobacteria bacterium]